MLRIALVLVAACGAISPKPPPPPPVPEGAEALSLLGEPLVAPALEPDELAVREAALATARAEAEREPDSADAAIWVGRRLGYLNRFREAVEVFTAATAKRPRTPGSTATAATATSPCAASPTPRPTWRAPRSSRRDPPDRGRAGRDAQTRGTSRPARCRTTSGTTSGSRAICKATSRARSRRSAPGSAERPTTTCGSATTYWLWNTSRRLGLEADARALLDPIRADRRSSKTTPTTASAAVQRGGDGRRVLAEARQDTGRGDGRLRRRQLALRPRREEAARRARSWPAARGRPSGSSPPRPSSPPPARAPRSSNPAQSGSNAGVNSSIVPTGMPAASTPPKIAIWPLDSGRATAPARGHEHRDRRRDRREGREVDQLGVGEDGAGGVAAAGDEQDLAVGGDRGVLARREQDVGEALGRRGIGANRSAARSTGRRRRCRRRSRGRARPGSARRRGPCAAPRPARRRR